MDGVRDVLGVEQRGLSLDQRRALGLRAAQRIADAFANLVTETILESCHDTLADRIRDALLERLAKPLLLLGGKLFIAHEDPPDVVEVASQLVALAARMDRGIPWSQMTPWGSFTVVRMTARRRVHLDVRSERPGASPRAT
ncbi:hypothetical protein BON30_25590 [Cystobacter ferrugineus]|uniref:Uncharacterized protein n=1 Tax=Cystobacter ferrugineus TaxID=83449 RepID=A0A1L9B5P8_9BACT|nr:hypothetical protein BON30_25590 [Cystobacter ferrugineus]